MEENISNTNIQMGMVTEVLKIISTMNQCNYYCEIGRDCIKEYYGILNTLYQAIRHRLTHKNMKDDKRLEIDGEFEKLSQTISNAEVILRTLYKTHKGDLKDAKNREVLKKIINLRHKVEDEMRHHGISEELQKYQTNADRTY